MRRIWVWARSFVIMGLTVGACSFAGCTFTVDTGSLTNEQCPGAANQTQKVCLVDGKKTCVSTDKPDYGCNAGACLSCGALGFKNVKTSSCHPVTRTCVVSACQDNFAHCDGPDSAGCETSLLASDQNCGACRNNCLAIMPPNTPQVHCMTGKCTVTECANGYTDCNTVPTDGCECPPTKTCVNRTCM
jgi:hypothetical protein